MDKYEIRRLNLARLKKEFCNNKQTELAAKLGRRPSYVSRMLSAPENPSHRRIGDNMVDEICSAFGLHYSWLDEPPEDTELTETRKGIVISEVIEFDAEGMEISCQSGARISTPFIGLWRDYVAFQILSDTFYPRIRSGEYIVLQKENEPMPGDDILVVHDNGKRSLHCLVSDRESFIQVAPIHKPDRPKTLFKSELRSYESILSIITAR